MSFDSDMSHGTACQISSLIILSKLIFLYLFSYFLETPLEESY